MRVAVLDLGTNVFNLLLCSFEAGRCSHICEYKRAARLGAGGLSGGRIADTAFETASDALSAIMRRIDDHFDLFIAQLLVIRSIIGCTETAVDHDLNKIRAHLDLIAHRVAEEIYTRSDSRCHPGKRFRKIRVSSQILRMIPMVPMVGVILAKHSLSSGLVRRYCE